MSRIACAVAVAVAVAAGWPAGANAKDKAPELGVAEQLDAAINASNVPNAVALFAEDATVRTPDGTTLTGRAQVEGWLRSLAGQGWHMDSGNRQLSDGGRVTWAASVVYAGARQLGVTPLAAFVEATVIAGRVRTLSIRFSAEAQQRLAQAKARADEAVARSFVDGVVSRGDLARADSLLAPGFVDHDPAPGKAGDAAGLKAGVAELRASFPDLKYTIEDVVVSGDRVVVRGACAGSQQGPFLGSAASGRAFLAGFVEVLRIVDGRITERWGMRDTMKIMDQLGFSCVSGIPAAKPAAAPAPAAPAVATPTPAPAAAPPAEKPAPKPADKKGGWF